MIAFQSVIPHVDKNVFACLMGARNGHRFSHSLDIKIQDCRQTLLKSMDTRLFYLEVEIDRVDNGTVSLKGGPFFRSPKLARTLHDCDALICFVATIGDVIDAQISRMMSRNRLSEAYVLDALGSAMVENMTEHFHGYMENKYRDKGKAVTFRFSPGYCDWPVTEQKKLFMLFDSNRTGIALHNSCLMRPRKSISGVFGICSKLSSNTETPAYNPCMDCSKIDCSARRTKRIDREERLH